MPRPYVLAPADADAVLRVAAGLGMLASPAPSHAAYDVAVVLGGTALGDRLRAAHLSRLEAAGTSVGLVVGLVVGLAARPAAYRGRASRRGPPLAHDEAQDLPRVPAGAVPGDGLPYLRSPADVAVPAGGGRALRVMSTPSGPRGRRPDTDAAAFLVFRLPSTTRGRALLVTISVYVPYQLLTADPVLGKCGARLAT